MPYRVVLNEGINLAKYFGADGSHRYVNGILDKVAQKKRTVEVKNKVKDSKSI
jgi:N utilization substance protein B